MCHCSCDEESISQFLLYCPTFTTERQVLRSTLTDIDHTLLENTDITLTNILLFDDVSFDRASNTQILDTTIESILSTKKFEEPLL